MTAPVLRVLVLAATPARRQAMQAALETDARLLVLAGAADAPQAIELAARRQADVIVVGQGGGPADAAAWVRSIMQARPTPVVVVSGSAAADHDRQAFALMEAGALAVLRDPAAESGPAQKQALAALLESVRLMAEVKMVRRWVRAAADGPAAVPPAVAAHPLPLPAVATSARGSRIELVAIGASTGGPVALKQLLCALPADFPVPIVIVQHMADGFLPGLVDWLTVSCAIRTEIGVRHTLLQPGRAYLAPDGMHMRVTPERQLALVEGPPLNGHRPSVGCLFASVAEHLGRHAIGILLTGMGRDGAVELKLLKDAGGITIAQDEASSVVHGMPGEAIRRGGASYVMSPEEIAAALPGLVQR